MPTATAKPEAPKFQVKLPALSPYIVPNLLCPDRTCNTIMTDPKAGIDPKSGEQILYFTCPNCHYHAKMPLVHSNATCVPEGKLDVKGPEEGLLGHARA
jgi:hypothetical protein